MHFKHHASKFDIIYSNSGHIGFNYTHTSLSYQYLENITTCIYTQGNRPKILTRSSAVGRHCWPEHSMLFSALLYTAVDGGGNEDERSQCNNWRTWCFAALMPVLATRDGLFSSQCEPPSHFLPIISATFECVQMYRWFHVILYLIISEVLN